MTYHGLDPVCCDTLPSRLLTCTPDAMIKFTRAERSLVYDQTMYEMMGKGPANRRNATNIFQNVELIICASLVSPLLVTSS